MPTPALLLDAVVPGGLDEEVRERILAEANGNPLALLELPRGLTPAELAGGFGLPDEPELSSRIEQTFLRRVQALPPDTQRALLVAAAEAVGDAAVIAQAASRLGVGAAGLIAAEDAGLVELGRRVRFRHPLVRSAAYRAATPHERRRAHEALAAATDPERDPDRRAWHRAHAAAGADESVAAELERSASRAQARGGVAAAAAFLERAAELSPDAAQRGTRALAAARLKLEVGALEATERLLTVATTAPLGELDRARAERLRAQIAYARTRGSDTPALLSAAAKRLEPLDPELARETHLEALWAAVRSGRFAKDDWSRGGRRGGDAPLRARAGARDRPAVGSRRRAAHARVRAGVAGRRARPCGLSRRGIPARAPRLVLARLPTRAGRSGRTTPAKRSRAARLASRARADPSPSSRSHSTTSPHRSSSAGEFGIAEQMIRERETITAATRSTFTVSDSPSCSLPGAAIARRRTSCARPPSKRGRRAERQFAIEIAEWAAAVLHNGLGEYADAAAAAQRAYDHDVLGFGGWVLPELIEAAVRSGDRPAAELAFARLAERTSASAKEWARGIEAAMRALLSDGAEAEALHLEAIDQLSRSRVGRPPRPGEAELRRMAPA